MSPDPVKVVQEWERQRGDEYRAHFEQAHSYLSDTIRELASPEATWTIAPHDEDHPVLLLASDTAFALLAFSGKPDAVTLKGALHPIDEHIIRVSFADELSAQDVEANGVDRFKPMIRRWSFDWHGRFQQTIEYWLELGLPPISADSPFWLTLRHHGRQRAMAHKLATAAGWPMPAEGSSGEAR